MFENNLSMKQEQAISLMMMGKSDTEIGKEVGGEPRMRVALAE